MNIQEMADMLRNNRDELSVDEVIELCFIVMEQHKDVTEQCYAAVILSGLVKPGLGDRVLEFLEDNPQLPARARQLLSANIMRMETF